MFGALWKMCRKHVEKYACDLLAQKDVRMKAKQRVPNQISWPYLTPCGCLQGQEDKLTAIAIVTVTVIIVVILIVIITIMIQACCKL